MYIPTPRTIKIHVNTKTIFVNWTYDCMYVFKQIMWQYLWTNDSVYLCTIIYYIESTDREILVVMNYSWVTLKYFD